MKKKILIGSIIAVVIIAIVAANLIKGSSSMQTFSGGGKAFNVSASKIKKGSISTSISSGGSVEELQKSEVYLDTGLRVDKILVEKNDKVAKGQQIVSVSMDSLNSELEQLKIKRTIQELAIEKIRIMSGSKSTATLETSVSVAENNLKNAENAYNESVKSYEKSKALYEASAISKSELERAEKTVSDTKIAYDNAYVNYNSAVSNLEETKKANEKSESSTSLDLKTQEQNLRATILTIEDMEKRIKKITDSLLSPISGTVADITLKEGGLTNGAQPSFTVTSTDKLIVKAAVKEFDIKGVAVGQNVAITGDAIPKEDNVTGKVTSIATSARKNRTTNGEETVIDVTISINNTGSKMMPGLVVTCNIFTEEKKDALLVELGMLGVDKNNDYYVFVVDEEKNTISQKKIKTGLSSDMYAEAVEGLKEGELVVTDPQPTLKDGARVKVDNNSKK